MRLPSTFKRRGKRGEPLKKLTTFKIGGPVEFCARPQGVRELRELLLFCRAGAVPVRVIGCGSNILSSDTGVAGVIIKLDSSAFRFVRLSGRQVEAGAGASLAELLTACCAAGLSGLEFLAGIPGTVGGGLAMNCGVSTKAGAVSIGDRVDQVSVMGYDGTISVEPGKSIAFGYRSSGLTGCVIVSARFTLKQSNATAVRKLVREWMFKRKGQEYSLPSAGCVFKNPSKDCSAGRLIEECGLKGTRVGGACVSEKHANFIVNTGNATCSDVISLMKLVRREVKKRHGVNLESEIEIWK